MVPRASAPGHRPRWAPASVRARLTLAATAALGVALVLAAAVALAVVRTALLSSLDDAAGQRAREVAALADAGPLPDPLPVTGAAVVQVLDAEQRVLASSPGGDRLSPLVAGDDLRAARAGDPVSLDGARLGSGERYRVLALPLRAGTGDAAGGTVLVATSVAEVERSTGVLRRAAALGVPLLLAAVALLAWRVTGSALAPVEALRRGAQALVLAPAPRRGGADSAPPAPAAPARSLPVPASGDEVARLAETLNDVLGRMHAAGDRQREFSGDAAHELRSPLGSLRTQLEVALARPDDQDWPQVARDCLTDVERTAVLVEDLLVLSRLEEPSGARAPVDVGVLGREVLASAGWRVPVQLVQAPGGGDLPVLADARSLRRAVVNLVANAARHADTAVEVRTRREAGDVVLDVVDDGPGIAPADRERVFGRFTRLDDARDRDAGGAGLGLAIARAAVERDGGTLVALEPPGHRGALLRIRLPLAPQG